MNTIDAPAGRSRRLLARVVPAVLSNTAYRRIWFSGLIYYQTYWMEIVTTGWVVLALTGSPSAVGLAAFFRTLPMLLLGMVFGSLTDRFPRTHVLIAVQLVGMATAAAVALVFVAGVEQFWILCVSTAMIGCCQTADYATRRSLIAELNTPETTGSAMSLEALSMQGGKIIAPVIAGLVLGLSGPAAAYALLGVIFLSGIFAVLWFRIIQPAVPARSRQAVSTLYLLRSGWTTALEIPLVRMALLVTVITNVLVFPYQPLISLIAVEILDIGPGRMGVLAGAAGIGSATMAGFLVFRVRPDAAKRFFIGGVTVGAMLLMVLAASTNFYFSVSLQILLGACFGAFGAMQPVLIIAAVAPEMRARALGIMAMTIGTGPFGLLMTGFLSSWIGPALTIGGMSLLASLLLLGLIVRYRRMLFDAP